MKKNGWFLTALWAVSVALGSATTAQASNSAANAQASRSAAASSTVKYCATTAVGYGASATGGGNATPVLVSSVSELETAMKAKAASVVIITQDLTFTTHLSITATNKTLMALPGVKLTSAIQNKDNSGILYIKNSKNIILRNLTFVGPGAYDCDGWDLLCFDGVTNAWVDHCDFQDGCDGNFDNKGNTDNITVTFCRFRYLKTPKAGGSGGTDDHRFSNLLGSSSSDKPSDGTYNMTWAYCWWDEGCVERMLRCRNASLHFLNCYWNSSVAHYYIGPENADCYVEGCTFGGTVKKANIFYENYEGTNGVKFVSCDFATGTPSNVSSRTVVTPAYTYTALTAAEAKTMVTDATCGAGATLTVTTAGAVSSSCDGSDTPDPDPTPDPDTDTDGDSDTSGAITYNFSDSDFDSLEGDITSSVTVNGLTIVGTSDKPIVLEASSKTYGTLTFSRRLKLGGTMATDARYVSFAVTGACKIEVYGISGNGSTTRSLKLADGSGNELYTWSSVTGTELNYLTYNYTGGAATLRIGSGNSGVNLYGINIIYPTTPTDIEQPASQPTGKRYNLLGQEVDKNYRGVVIVDGEKRAVL